MLYDEEHRFRSSARARIDALLHAQPVEFAAAVTDIDTALQAKIDQLTEHRRRIAELASGEELVLPSEMVAILNRLRSLGVSERTVRLERDWAILMQASDPHASPQWIRDKIAGFDDSEKMRLYLACDQSVGCDPHDPRVDQLIDDLETWEIEHQGNSSRPENPTPLFSLILSQSPAWHRILATLASRAERRRTAVTDG